MANTTQNYVPMVGVDKLHYGKITSDTAEGITGTVPVEITGLTEAGFNRNAQSSTFYADNGPYATAAASGDFDGAIAVADIPPALYPDLYGDAYDTQTGELLIGDIESPECFIQYRIQKSNGAYRYVTVYKCKFTPNETKVQTKGGSINFQTNGFSFKASKTKYNGKLCRILDDDDPKLPAGVTPAIIASKWFTDVNWVISAS